MPAEQSAAQPDTVEETPSRRAGGGLAALFVLLWGCAGWLIATALWEAARWDALTLTEIVGQVGGGMDGTSQEMLNEYLLWGVLPGLLTALVAVGVFLLFGRGNQILLARIGALLALAVSLGMLAYAFITLDVGGYFTNAATRSDYIQENYADPAQVPLTFPAEKRNLIYIWLESMETTFTDTDHGGAFSYDPIPELTDLAGEGTSFTGTQGGVNGGLSMAGATWTAGALFAQTAGLPLKIPIADSSMGDRDRFFPGVTALGDILDRNGYRQVLLIGSDATFGGRRQYFSQHGSYAIRDYGYSKKTGQIPKNYYVWWGYEDAKLFDFAKEHILDLAAGEGPFNLSLLTVDTHFPDGYVCPDCGTQFGENQYANVMACSSHRVGEFIAWLKEQPFYENTTVVIAGDHITMDADYCQDIPADYQRKTYTTILNPAAQPADPARHRDFTTFDNFPTTLAALGVTIPGDRLGLGTNLFSARDTLLERDGAEEMNRELARQSDFMDGLTGMSRRVFRLSERFANVDAEITAAFQWDRILVRVDGLSQIEKEMDSLNVLADVIQGDTRTTLWGGTAKECADGSYLAILPLDRVRDQDTFTIHLYADTGEGRIQVGRDYLCSISQRGLVYEDATSGSGFAQPAAGG